MSGRVSEESDYSPNGILLQRLVYHYDDNGRVAKINAFDASGNEVNQTRDTPRKPSRRH